MSSIVAPDRRKTLAGGSHSCTAYLCAAFSSSQGGKFTVSQSIILYRKFRADNIFTGYQMLGSDQVLITDEKGKVIEIATAESAGDDIQQLEGILSPGFINAHCHLELSHMQGRIPEHTGLVDFVLQVITGRQSTEDEIMAAIEKADNEMYENGIVAVGDICNTTSTIHQKQKSRIRYHNFIETIGFPPAVAADRFQRSQQVYEAFNQFFPANSIVPHAPYSVSPALFEMINAFPGNTVLTIHNQEATAENEFFQHGTGGFTKLYERLNIDISFFKPSGKTSLQTFLPLLKNYQSLILVHNVYTSSADHQSLITHHSSLITDHPSTYYCLCPNANLYITNTLPDINIFLQPPPGPQAACGVSNIVLGTDSLASNHRLNILHEIQTLRKNFPSLELPTLLQWATINGARALHMDHELGSFEKDKTPGVILITDSEKIKRLL